MIEKFEVDIYTLKERKDQQESSLASMMKAAREDEMVEEMEKDIESQISHIQEVIRNETSVNNKLKGQYQKFYEILCSTVSRNVR
jgi:hypothetical protein